VPAQQGAAQRPPQSHLICVGGNVRRCAPLMLPFMGLAMSRRRDRSSRGWDQMIGAARRGRRVRCSGGWVARYRRVYRCRLLCEHRRCSIGLGTSCRRSPTLVQRIVCVRTTLTHEARQRNAWPAGGAVSFPIETPEMGQHIYRFVLSRISAANLKSPLVTTTVQRAREGRTKTRA
jgi:hypothetical protein